MYHVYALWLTLYDLLCDVFIIMIMIMIIILLLLLLLSYLQTSLTRSEKKTQNGWNNISKIISTTSQNKQLDIEVKKRSGSRGGVTGVRVCVRARTGMCACVCVCVCVCVCWGGGGKRR